MIMILVILVMRRKMYHLQIITMGIRYSTESPAEHRKTSTFLRINTALFQVFFSTFAFLLGSLPSAHYLIYCKGMKWEVRKRTFPAFGFF